MNTNKEDDLIIGGGDSEEEIEEVGEAELIPYSPHDDIAASYNALMAVSDMDSTLQSKIDQIRIKQIKRWALRVIHDSMKGIYEDCFGELPKEPDKSEEED